MKAKMIASGMLCIAAMAAGAADIADYDPRMAVATAKVENGVKWIDGVHLPIEGRAFDNTAAYYDRLPKTVTTNVNAGVRGMLNHTTGMQLRFRTDSKRVIVKWVPVNSSLAMDHMPATGVSGVDVYCQEPDGKWRYVNTGRIYKPEGSQLSVSWTPGDACLINLPLYNGVKSIAIGIDEGATISAPPPHQSGVTKPVVFYGTSITHGGCASRPGLSFVNIVGRELDVPVVNLGFSGSGKMELEMSEHLAVIDASCYVLDCLWNMDMKMVEERYEPFIRNLRAKRPGVPIVMAEQCDVYLRPGGSKRFGDKDRFVRALYDKLVAEGWKDLVYLRADEQFDYDGEGTVDGCHPNDIGMAALARGFGAAVAKALKLR